MIQIDLADDGVTDHQFKLTFINIMGEAKGSEIDVKYGDASVGKASLNDPTTQGAFEHNLLTVEYEGVEKFQVGGVWQGFQ